MRQCRRSAQTIARRVVETCWVCVDGDVGQASGRQIEIFNAQQSQMQSNRTIVNPSTDQFPVILHITPLTGNGDSFWIVRSLFSEIGKRFDWRGTPTAVHQIWTNHQPGATLACFTMDGDYIASILRQPIVDGHAKLFDYLQGRWVVIVERKMSDPLIKFGRIVLAFRAQIVDLRKNTIWIINDYFLKS